MKYSARAWVLWLERKETAKNEVKSLKGPSAASLTKGRGPNMIEQIFVTTTQLTVMYFFQGGVLFSIENVTFLPFLASFG